MADGGIVIVSGASQSGKTTKSMREAGRERRCIAWDPDDQWSTLPGFRRVITREDLLRMVQRAGDGPARIAYVARGRDLASEFNFWAATALYWGRYGGGCAAVAEELADVSSPGKAPWAWGLLLRRGIKRGITIYAISQRWAEADKTALGNATRWIIFAAATTADAKYIAQRTRVTVDQIEGLQNYEFIEYDPRAKKTSKKQRVKMSRGRNRAGP